MSALRVDRLRRVRRERLLALLPRIYREQPEGSAVWALIDALAGRLAALDEAAQQVLRDRWIALAGDDLRFTDGQHPVDLLGHLVGIWREAWEENVDDDERFRRRVQQIAPALTGGATTPRGVLTVAAAAIDAELCCRVLRAPIRDDGKDGDTTLGWGVRPGTVAHCDGCKNLKGRCQYDESPQGAETPLVARFELTDNPISTRSLRLTGVANGQRFFPKNASLAADRPTVTLLARTRLAYPALQNMGTGEVVLFAGTLNEGDLLTIWSERTSAEVVPFGSHASIGPAAAPPFAKALETKGDIVSDVSKDVFYLRGEVFDKARFVGENGRGPQFAVLGNRCRTPRIEPGEGVWVFRTYGKKDINALADKTLRSTLGLGAPERPDKGTADLTLTWWVRPPATFRLTVVPLSPAGPGREEVAALLRKSVERVRAAGVLAFVDMGRAPFSAELKELAGAVDRPPTIETVQRFTGERHELADGQLFFRAAFGMTRFGSSSFG